MDTHGYAFGSRWPGTGPANGWGMEQEASILAKRVDKHRRNLFYPFSSLSANGPCGIAEKDRVNVFHAKAHPIFLASGIFYRPFQLPS